MSTTSLKKAQTAVEDLKRETDFLFSVIREEPEKQEEPAKQKELAHYAECVNFALEQILKAIEEK